MCPTCSRTLRALRALVPYVLSYLTCLVTYMFSGLCPTCLVPYVLSCLTCLVPYAPLAVHALVSHVPYVPRAKRALVSHVSYMLLHLMCLVPCVFSGCSCLELYVLFCSSSLTCSRCFKPNMFLCISCLVAFMPCASYAFVALAI